MGGDSLLMSLWKPVGGGFTGKGGSEVWVDCSCWLTWVAA